MLNYFMYFFKFERAASLEGGGYLQGAGIDETLRYFYTVWQFLGQKFSVIGCAG